MNRLPPDAQKLLAQLRHLDDPTPHERQQAAAAVREMLVAHKLRTLPRLSVPVLPPSARQHANPVSSGWTWKLLSGSATVAALLALGFWSGSAWRKSERWGSDEVFHERTGAQLPPAPDSTAPALQPIAAEPPTAMLSPRTLERVPQASLSRPVPRNHKLAEDSLAEELRFIASVDAEVRAGAYDRALRRLSHASRTPSQLQEERSAMRVLALCGRDHDSAAARARDQFLKSSPSSLLTARVRDACTDVAP